MAGPLLAKQTAFGTVGLEIAGAPSPIMQAPQDAAVLLRGFVYGTPGEFAHFASSNNPFASASGNTNFPFYGDAYSVACGERFEVYLAPMQSLVAIGTVALSLTGGVWVTFTACFLTPEATFETEFGTPLGDAGTFRGPGFGFRKR